MAGKLGGLAERVKRNIEAAESRAQEQADTREAEQAARRAKIDAAQAARAELLDDIAGFGMAVGHLEVVHSGHVALTFRGQTARFEPDGEYDRIAIRLPEQWPRNHHLSRDEEGEWVVALDIGGKLQAFPLEMGIERVLRELGVASSNAEAVGPSRTERSSSNTTGSAEGAPSPKGSRPSPGSGHSAPPGSALRELKSSPLD